MILRMLRHAMLKDFLSFLTPGFWEVLPTGTLLRAGKELLSNLRDSKGFAQARGPVGEAVERYSVAIVPKLNATPEPQDPQRRGEAVLACFFEEVCHQQAALLDLQFAQFADSADSIRWAPRQFWIRWDPTFHGAICDIYAGFFLSQPERFDAGLKALGMEPIRDVFKEQFGFGGEEAQKFSVADFQNSFRAVFEACKREHVSLHPNFIALGFLLASLYEHLERLDVAINTAAIFKEVHERTE